MNNVDAMLKAIELNPDDLTAEVALTDLLVEERDMQPTEAAAAAANALQTARDARDLAEAARLMQKDQPWHVALCTDIRRTIFLPDYYPCTIVVVVGDSAPGMCDVGEPTAPPFWTGDIITVGALWVVRHFRSNPALCLLAEKSNRRRRHSR